MSEKQLGHYETLKKMPKLNIDCILYVFDVSYENLALILRSADVFGVKEVYYHQDNKIEIGSRFLKISRNSKIPILFSENASVLVDFKIDGYNIAALEITDTSVPLRMASFPKKVCLVIGNEQYGVPEEILRIVDNIFHIEMIGEHISSLNVSIATSIALYEISQFFIKQGISIGN